MNKNVREFLDQIRECDRIIEQEELKREELYKRIDEELAAGHSIDE
jgi:hypothetical protein